MIVDAEKEAAKILEDAQNRASEIRRRLDSLIEEQRKQILQSAKREAAAIVSRAEEEGRLEAENYGKSSEARVREMLARASSRKNAAVERHLRIIMESEA